LHHSPATIQILSGSKSPARTWILAVDFNRRQRNADFMDFTYDHKGVTYTIRLEAQADGAYTATINGRVQNVRAYPLPDGGWRLVLDGQTIIAYSAADGNTRHVAINGESHTLTIPDSRTRRRTAAHAGDLTAQMPGQVIAISVNEGDAVQTGQTLVVLEAMKMEIRVAAPGDGVVKKLLVAVGDVVERGQRLVEIVS
jgi:3-methylcrotonyl-CoA carboxylase alpha subunit